MKKDADQNNHYIEDHEEWLENQYNPGYYLGGKIPGNLLYSGRPKMIGALLIGIGIITLVPFALGIIVSFRNDAPRMPIEYVLLFLQILGFGGFSMVLIVNGIKKVIGKTKGGVFLKVKLETVRYIDQNKPMVALTFDDGPSLEYTPEILKALRENDAKATFFVLGTEAELNADILKQIAESGNEIGNHSYSHLDLTKLEEPAFDYQVLTAQEIVRRETGTAPILIRPPYGSINEAVRKIDMPIILWSIDSLDWQDRNPDVIYNRVINNIKDGDIILMHDIYKTSAEAVLRIIPELKRRGYQLVTVSDLARARGIPLMPGNVYGNLYPSQA